MKLLYNYHGNSNIECCLPVGPGPRPRSALQHAEWPWLKQDFISWVLSFPRVHVPVDAGSTEFLRQYVDVTAVKTLMRRSCGKQNESRTLSLLEGTIIDVVSFISSSPSPIPNHVGNHPILCSYKVLSVKRLQRETSLQPSVSLPQYYWHWRLGVSLLLLWGAILFIKNI